MSLAEKLLFVYAGANIAIFCLYCLDKSWAQGRSRHRISENVLILLSVLGVIGANLAIPILNHKVKKRKFQIFIPIITILEVSLFIMAKTGGNL